MDMNLKFYKLVAYAIVILLCFPVRTISQDQTPIGNFTFHSVEKKETVFSIAKEYGVTPEEIYKYNPKSKENIKPGDVLQIPQPEVKGTKKDQKGVQAIILHTVRKKETLYFISQKYKCSQEEILKLNPGINAIQKGMVVKVPNPDFIPSAAKSKGSPNKFIEYTLVSGDNYFQMKKRFGIEKEELERLNPVLKNGFNAGVIIKIPVKSGSTESEAKKEDNQLTEEAPSPKLSAAEGKSAVADPNRTYNIAFYLPFCGNLNDSAKLSSKTLNYLEFYEGAMLAVEKIASEGMKLKLYVYDTYQDPKVAEHLAKKPEFLSLDLIVGPVYPECQKVISELSAKNRIPMVSPLSSDSRYVSTNPYYFQINPDRKLRFTGTAEYIAKEYPKQKIILISNGNDNEDQKMLIERLKRKINPKDLHIYNLWSEGVSGLESLMNADGENIVVMTEDDEANLSIAFTRLNTVSKTYKITLIGLQEYSRLQSINLEYLHNLKLHYLAPYFIDYTSKQVNGFIDKYRLTYSGEPTQFSFQGYDITTDFLTALRLLGKKFASINSVPKVDLLQADYNFQRISTFGGYENRTLFIMEYTNSYEVKSVGKIVEPF
jgi:LysM repeat protein/ABC-type branched-subunit amino acid transport system substrate-binding protein